jgi:hypothetical protein
MAPKPVITYENAIIYTFVGAFGTMILAGEHPKFCTTVYANCVSSGSCPGPVL